jgi:DNA-binding NarL/FixJ family response regulator
VNLALTAKQRKQFEHWNRVLAAEGLAPLDSEKEAAKLRRNVQRLAKLTEVEREGVSIYYDSCANHLDGLRRANRPYRVWQLHTEGLGRREIARRLGKPEKTVRTYLERQHKVAGLVSPSWGGRSASD